MKSCIMMFGALLASTAMPVLADAENGQTASAAPQGELASRKADGRTENYPDSGSPADIIVTAQKRSENLKDVPISITAVSGDALRKSAINSFDDLSQQVPGFTNAEYGDSRAGKMTLRGVASQQDNPGKQSSLGVFLDGVFLARAGSIINELGDVERLEVLRGPQGTLFGANTAAGLINIVTRKPDLGRATGYMEGVVGDYGQLLARGNISVPLAQDRLAASLYAYGDRRGGVTRNVTTDRDVDNIRRMGGRAKLFYKGDGLDILLTGDYERERGECCTAIFTGLRPGATTVFGTPLAPLMAAGYPYSRKTIEDEVNTDHNQGGGVSAEVNVRLGDLTLTSLTAWRIWHTRPISDVDSLPLRLLDNFLIDQKHDQFSQELRLTSPSGRTIEFVGGLYYFSHQTDDLEVLQPGPDAAAVIMPGEQGDTTIKAHLNDKSYAAFGHVDINWNSIITTSGGLRYTRENQDVFFTQTSTNYAFPSLGSIQRARHEGKLSWVVNTRAKFTPDLTGYVSIARGYKPGGFDVTRLPNFNNFEFQAETNTNYEIGLKGDLLDHAVRFSTALFLTNYNNFQAQAFDGLNIVTRNADEFRTKGGELELTVRPIRGLTLNAQASYTDGKYVKFTQGACPPGGVSPCDLSGKRLPLAPKFTLTGSIDYRQPLSARVTGFARFEGDHRSSIYFQQNLDPYTLGHGRTVFGAHLGIETDSGLLVELFAKNLFNEKYITFIYPSPLSNGGYAGYVGTPRMVGARLRFDF